MFDKKKKAKTLVEAKTGDKVKLGAPEYDLVDGGKAVRVLEAVKSYAVYTRVNVMKRKAEIELELESIKTVLSKMDKLGVE